VDGWDTAKPNAVGSETFDTILDLDASNAVATRRLFGAGFDEVLAKQDAAGNATRYDADKLGSVRTLFDNSGNTTASRDYSGFGAITTQTGAGLDRYAFTSREWDAAIGLQYSRARMYDPATGRWTSEDPMGFAAGDANLSRYVGNHATGATDPSGYQPLTTAYYDGPSGYVTSVNSAAVMPGRIDPTSNSGQLRDPSVNDVLPFNRDDGWLLYYPGAVFAGIGEGLVDMVIKPAIRTGQAVGDWWGFANRNTGDTHQANNPHIRGYIDGDRTWYGTAFDLALDATIVIPLARGVTRGISRATGVIPHVKPPVIPRAPKSAYEIVKEGGKHAGWLKPYEGKPIIEIKRGIRSLEKQIAEHERALIDPKSKIPNWDTLDPRQQKALIEKEWPKQIQRQMEQRDILEGLLNEKQGP